MQQRFRVVAGRCYVVGAAWRTGTPIMLFLSHEREGDAHVNQLGGRAARLTGGHGRADPLCADANGTMIVSAHYLTPGGAPALKASIEVALSVTARDEDEQARVARHAQEAKLIEEDKARRRAIGAAKEKLYCDKIRRSCMERHDGSDCVYLYDRCMGNDP